MVTLTREELDQVADRIETELDNDAANGWSSYPADLAIDYEHGRMRVIFADNSIGLFDLTTGKEIDTL